MLIAHRWQIQDSFTLIFLKKHSKPVTCAAGPGFAVVLNQLTSLKLLRTLTPKEAHQLLQKYPTRSWAEVLVRDNSALEPFRALIMPVPGQTDAAFVHFNGATYVVSFADQIFRLILGGCKQLAASSFH